LLHAHASGAGVTHVAASRTATAIPAAIAIPTAITLPADIAITAAAIAIPSGTGALDHHAA